MSLRAYYNYLLFRLGVRKVLPARFINRLPVQECGEELVSCQGKYVRKTVCEMLAKAERLLPNGYSIKLLDGYRSEKEQLRRREQLFKQLDAEHPEWTADERERYVNQSIAKKSGHNTGGAVDVILAHEGKELDCGTAYLEFTPLTRTDAKGLTDIQQKNREMLFQAMTAAGFVNYPLEWWHYCYGDKMYAAYKCLPLAQYGSIERSMKNDDVHE
ncbi:MAG: D-alanyl-D-alanine carboxypeptidase family protein [Victivallales bacterium]|nr:D-alanyl-D-alanine carboxypeptidase family protein [Victivallales bacterium]